MHLTNALFGLAHNTTEVVVLHLDTLQPPPLSSSMPSLKRLNGFSFYYLLSASASTCRIPMPFTVTRTQSRELIFSSSCFSQSLAKGGTFGTECIQKMARKCNVWPSLWSGTAQSESFNPTSFCLISQTIKAMQK